MSSPPSTVWCCLCSRMSSAGRKKWLRRRRRRPKRMLCLQGSTNVCSLQAQRYLLTPSQATIKKDDLLDIAIALSLDHTGTIPVLTERIQTHLVNHPDVASQPRFSGLLKAHKTHKCTRTDMDAPSQDQAGPSNYST